MDTGLKSDAAELGRILHTALDEDVERFKEKAEQFFKELAGKFPHNNPAVLQALAEEMAAPYFFQNIEAERPRK